MTTDFVAPSPGDSVKVKVANYSFGPSFLAGDGIVLENRDFMSRQRGEIVIHFPERNVTGIFRTERLKELMEDTP